MLVQARPPRRRNDLLVGCLGTALGDVVADGTREQEPLLRRVADPSGELLAGELGYVGPVQ